MKKYETIVHIITEGMDAFEAGEIAGELLDVRRIEDDVIVNCEPTRPFIERKEKDTIIKKYETVIHIIMEAYDALEAGEIAGELFDIREMVDDMIISCEPTRLFIPLAKNNKKGNWRDEKEKFNSYYLEENSKIIGTEARAKTQSHQ